MPNRYCFPLPVRMPLTVYENVAQTRRASEECVFMIMGKVVEHSPTEELFVTPNKQETADYIKGHYG